MNLFSIRRFWAMVMKEFVQMKRDRLTFGMIIGIPLAQLVLFGFAINTNPKRLPTGIVPAQSDEFSRAVVVALLSSEYFSVLDENMSEAEAEEALTVGDLQFVLHIPPDFGRDLLRGEHPSLLLESDATDPMATANAVSALKVLAQQSIDKALSRGALNDLLPIPEPANVIIHARYNPEAISQYNIVPGLLGVVLTMTMVIITSLAITREKERGTMEHLLATPLHPVEVMLGKILPYILVGYIQIGLILLAALLIFNVPMTGSVPLLLACSFVFVVANLAMGITFSTIARNQLQAVQMSVFFFLPSILLSGFMFPFLGMPKWAQAVGSILPLTHFVRLVRGILLKGNDFQAVIHHLWPVALFCVCALAIALKRYRQTLD
ncbi:MAG: ABC transporter permease [Opitutales bacterium]